MSSPQLRAIKKAMPRVLVVDDEASMRAGLRRVFSGGGYLRRVGHALQSYLRTQREIESTNAIVDHF